MGQRIGALWTKDGKTTGSIDAPAGINIPAGAKNIGISIVKNENKTKDTAPDWWVEVWVKDGAS